MEKECKICGKFFETDNKRKLCCDDCSSHYSSRRYEYEKGVEKSIKRMHEPKVLEGDCEECGKHFRTIEKLLFAIEDKKQKHIFCSDKCMKKYAHDHATCDECGCSLADKEYHFYAYHNFCSEECRASYERKAAIKAGMLQTCLYCGKEFIRREGKFCSRNCYLAAVKEGWQNTPVPVEYVTRKERCPVCGKVHEVTYRAGTNLQKVDASPCSPECRAKYSEKMKMLRKQATKKNSQNSPKELQSNSFMVSKKPKNPPAEKTERKPDESLCATCKVCYLSCERMKSNFRILPEGAHYNDKGILVECPKYKG